MSWHIETRDGDMGRVLVSDRSFLPGDVVVEEEPLLVWVDDSRRCGSLVRAFLVASSAVQDEILTFGHPATDDERVPFVSIARAEAAALAASDPDFAALGEARLMELLLIDATNAHSYHGGARNPQRHLTASNAPGDGTVRTKQCALFSIASKVAHSCRPNAIYTSTGTNGRLRYIASRPIAPGDLITFSYIESLQPRDRRRAALKEGKFFHCACARCSGVDDCRGLRCALTKTCRGILLRSDDGEENGGAWKCSACASSATDAALSEPIAAEASTTDSILWLQSRLDSGDAEIPLSVILSAIVAAASRLPLTHFAVLTGLRILVGLYTGEARGAAGVGEGDAARVWHERSARAGTLRVRLLECLDSECRKGDNCDEDHSPSMGAVVDVLCAINEAASAGMSLDFAWRYLPLLRARFGDKDADVLRVNQLLHSHDFKAGRGASVATIAAMVLTHDAASPLLLNDAQRDEDGNASRCAACDSLGARLRCSRCRLVSYCNSLCQRRDWVSHKHKCK
jgi:hypothetical protein